MNYTELQDKLQKTLSILENKSWNSREKLERAAMDLIIDFWKNNDLPVLKTDPMKISILLPDYPDEARCLFTYQFVFKGDKRKPDGYSNYLLQVILDPMLTKYYHEMDVLELSVYMSQHTAVLNNEQRLLQEKEQLLNKLRKVDEELTFVRNILKKYQ